MTTLDAPMALDFTGDPDIQMSITTDWYQFEEDGDAMEDDDNHTVSQTHSHSHSPSISLEVEMMEEYGDLHEEYDMPLDENGMQEDIEVEAPVLDEGVDGLGVYDSEISMLTPVMHGEVPLPVTEDFSLQDDGVASFEGDNDNEVSGETTSALGVGEETLVSDVEASFEIKGEDNENGESGEPVSATEEFTTEDHSSINETTDVADDGHPQSNTEIAGDNDKTDESEATATLEEPEHSAPEEAAEYSEAVAQDHEVDPEPEHEPEAQPEEPEHVEAEYADGIYSDSPPSILLTLSSSEPTNNLCLFALPGSSSSSASTSTYDTLFEDIPTLYYSSLTDLFVALRQDSHVSTQFDLSTCELFLEAIDLGLEISEDNAYTHEVTLHDLDILHEGSGPLRLRLHAVSPRFIIRFAMLQAQLNEHVDAEGDDEVEVEVEASADTDAVHSEVVDEEEGEGDADADAERHVDGHGGEPEIQNDGADECEAKPEEHDHTEVQPVPEEPEESKAKVEVETKNPQVEHSEDIRSDNNETDGNSHIYDSADTTKDAEEEHEDGQYDDAEPSAPEDTEGKAEITVSREEEVTAELEPALEPDLENNATENDTAEQEQGQDQGPNQEQDQDDINFLEYVEKEVDLLETADINAEPDSNNTTLEDYDDDTLSNESSVTLSLSSKRSIHEVDGADLEDDIRSNASSPGAKRVRLD